MGKLDGKHCIVTGASRGIGATIARVFAEEGARVTCAARTMKEGDHLYAGSLESTVSEIREAGLEAAGVAVDLSQYEECVRLVDEARLEFGPVDVLVNNAALTYFIPIKDFPQNRWLRSVAVNFHAPFYLSQLVLHDMVERRSGAIVNLSSNAAIGPGRGPYPEGAFRGGTLYGAEKAALERFTQGLASEVFADNVSVTCISPSVVVPTPGTVHHHLVDGLDDPRGEPPEYLAQAIVLLATEPVEKVSGRVCYSQQILVEHGILENGRGTPFDNRGSGYSEI